MVIFGQVGQQDVCGLFRVRALKRNRGPHAPAAGLRSDVQPRTTAELRPGRSCALGWVVRAVANCRSKRVSHVHGMK
jgi:hypothetical protein